MGIFDLDFKTASIRIVGIFVLMKLFATTQQILGEHEPVSRIVDISHEYSAAWNEYILTHPELSDKIMIFSSLLVDLSVAYLGVVSLFSKGWRTGVAASIVILLRQICQFTIEFPIPDGIYFKDPGFPSVFVTYDVKTDFYFSGHTSLMVVCALDIIRRNRNVFLTLLLFSLCVFQMGVVLVFRFHYIPDVITALFAAFASTYLGGKIGAQLDRKFQVNQEAIPRSPSTIKANLKKNAPVGGSSKKHA